MYGCYLNTTEPPCEDQSPLLPFKDRRPAGLKVIPSFVSEDEEIMLLQSFSSDSNATG